MFTKITCSLNHERVKRSTINGDYNKQGAARVDFCGASLGNTKYLQLDRDSDDNL